MYSLKDEIYEKYFLKVFHTEDPNKVNAGNGNTSDLIISSYVEGSSWNKVIEIYNGTGADVDLSQYSVKKAVNGSTTFGSVLSLSGILPSGEVYIVCHTNADAFIQNITNFTGSSSALIFNGNDVVALFKNGQVLDVVGVLGSAADFAKDVTLKRKVTAIHPVDIYNSDEWEVLPEDTYNLLGSHSVNGSISKGTLQRFVEALAGDWDETVINVAFTLLDATLIPNTVKNKFIPYLEKQLGIAPIHPSLDIRRKVLQRIVEIYKHKGTLRSYQLIFNALGFDDVEILQAGVDFGFDSSITFDNEIRTFDLGRCHKCRYYKLNLIGDVNIDGTMYNAIQNAIDVVEPIYARLYTIIANEVDVDIITIFVENNGDLVYSTISETNVGFTLMPNGDLVVYGENADAYSLDGNGNLVYNNEQ